MGLPKILLLTISHGAAHQRAASAIRQALLELQPEMTVEIVDALQRCARWFRLYYDSYQIPLKYWPALWGWIENFQRRQPSTGPLWLYRWGAQPLFHYIKAFAPDVVVATEVGVGEIAAMFKRENKATFQLIVPELMDFNQALVQAEVDLYPTTRGELAMELEVAGVPSAKILPCGYPISPSFASLPDRATVRNRLGIDGETPLLLVLFGGAGFGDPRRIVAELEKIHRPLETVFIAGRNRRLERELLERCRHLPRSRTLGWVDNVQEWMVAADLLLSKGGGATVMEAAACGLPMLAFDPLPGNERRTCERIERWGTGIWVRRPSDLAAIISRLLDNDDELRQMRQRALAVAQPRAALEAAEAILKLAEVTSQKSVVRGN